MTEPTKVKARDVHLGETVTIEGRLSFVLGWRVERKDGTILMAERAPLADSERCAVGAECPGDYEVTVGLPAPAPVRTAPSEDHPEGQVVGVLTLDCEVPGTSVLDFAITPVVTAAPDKPPKVAEYLASPRTTLDTRPRSTEHPYPHLDPKVETLRQLVQEGYQRATADDARRHRSKKLPDFRDHDGVQLQKLGVMLTATEAARPVGELAAEFVERVVAFERGLIDGAGGDTHVVRCFLKGHELPEVFPKWPPHHGNEDADGEAGAIKLRHVFGVLAP